jgi:DNA-binding beta-propeller fold protein YncE
MGKWRGAHVAGLLTLLGGLLAAVAAEAQDELFVANYGASSVTVYSRTASGDTAPIRTLSGLATELQFPSALAVDLTHNEVYVANAASVTVYSRTASGNTAPLRTLSGLATGLNSPQGLALDLTHNELVVANPATFTVAVYARTASGDTAPLRTLSGLATGLVGPGGVAVDLTHNELVVANYGNNSVTVYSRTASDNTAPLRMLSGAATGLIDPAGVALDLTNNELVVGNRGNNSATVYNRTASGNTAPLRTLSGAATGLINPAGVAVTASAAPLPALVAAVLPNARAIQVGAPVTVNATVINTGGAPALQVGIALASPVPASFGYWLLDTSVSPPQLVGAPNTPVGIPACAPPAPCPHKDFLLFMTPTGAFGPTELSLTFTGINTPPVATLIGINTLLLLASATPTPDMVALAATSTNDGIAQIPGVTGTGFFVVATTNLGVGDTITVSADTGAAVVPADLTVCETNSGTGICLAPPTPTVTTFVAAGAQPTFAYFIRGLGVAIPLDPAVNRVFARFRRSDSLIVGGTSVAVRTP